MKAKQLNRVRCAVAAAVAAFGFSSTAAEGAVLPDVFVDLELSLVTDVSSSISIDEFNLQMDGYAAAFRNPMIHSALSAGPEGAIAVQLIFFYSSAYVQIPWTVLTNSSDANAFADTLDNIARPPTSGTNPSAGITLATSEIFGNNIISARQVIDVSGDGEGDIPGADAAARDAALAAGVDAINGLSIGDAALAQYYQENIQGGEGSFTVSLEDFEDFQNAILEKLIREISGYDSDGSERLIAGSMRTGSISSARTVTRQVGGRIARLRSGLRSEGATYTEPAPAYSGKGGMAKGALPEPIVTTHRCPWEVWGQVYYSTEERDAQYARFPQGQTFVPNPVLVQAETDIDVFGGAVGIDYDIDENWTVGFAVSGARSDVDLSLVGNIDIDTLALIPYVSYYREMGGWAAYADLQYGYGMTDYETLRLPFGAIGSTEGDFHSLEFNLGANFKSGQVVHGPFGQLRWLDGEIDGYTEFGPGGFVVPSSDYESLASQLGYQVSVLVPVGSGTLVPQVSAAWEHEFEADQAVFAGIPAGELDEDLAVLGAGIGYYLNCGWNVVLDYEARLGSDSTSHYVGLKAGCEF